MSEESNNDIRAVMQSMLNRGMEIHISFLPAAKTMKECNRDHYKWNSYTQKSGETLLEALEELARARTNVLRGEAIS